jgi:hypothetical protein
MNNNYPDNMNMYEFKLRLKDLCERLYDTLTNEETKDNIPQEDLVKIYRALKNIQEHEDMKEPRYIIINKETGETEETFNTLKEAIQMLKYDTQYIWDTTTKNPVKHIEY